MTSFTNVRMRSGTCLNKQLSQRTRTRPHTAVAHMNTPHVHHGRAHALHTGALLLTVVAHRNTAAYHRCTQEHCCLLSLLTGTLLLTVVILFSSDTLLGLSW